MDNQINDLKSKIDSLSIDVACLTAHVRVLQETVFNMADALANQEQAIDLKSDFFQTLAQYTSTFLSDLDSELFHKGKALLEAQELTSVLNQEIRDLNTPSED